MNVNNVSGYPSMGNKLKYFNMTPFIIGEITDGEMQ